MGVIRHLEPDRIERLLSESFAGRLACNDPGKRPYLIPLAYAYDGEAVYAVSSPGRKIDLMRADPRVSFEVDQIERADRWQSVVVEAHFEEVANASEIQLAIGLIESATGAPVEMADHSIIFRLRITAKSGRYETPD